MGDKVSFFDSLVVTVFSMVVVFVVLIIIAYLINLLKVLSNTKKKTIEESAIIKNVDNDITIEENPEELIAVIAAAISASMGLDIPQVNIKTIKRLPQNSIPWSEMGRKEQIFGKL